MRARSVAANLLLALAIALAALSLIQTSQLRNRMSKCLYDVAYMLEEPPNMASLYLTLIRQDCR